MTTAFEAALAAKGVKAIEVRFNIALSEYLNNGGSIERARALIDAVAEKMGSEASCELPVGQSNTASASQPNESDGQMNYGDKSKNEVSSLSTERSGGHGPYAVEAIVGVPTAATKRNGAGRAKSADKASRVQPRPVSPAYLAAARAGAISLAEKLGWIGDAHIPGGPKFTQLRVRDVAGMIERQLVEGATHARAAIALRMIEVEISKMGVADPEALWVDVLPAETVKAISRETEAEKLKPMAVGWLRGLSNSVQEISHA